ncbi:hypothetical protein SAMN05443550_111133 [Pedobacter hartonius]|uniref:Uncharacterized protein n=1 Tax=Pedobacter hartonius TaxID=425514 RepID=A0A1H4GU69_9SPHI|nr:hypothetical protein SAMN05443550_111133 [Pedobacter hartonius]
MLTAAEAQPKASKLMFIFLKIVCSMEPAGFHAVNCHSPSKIPGVLSQLLNTITFLSIIPVPLINAGRPHERWYLHHAP